MNNLYVKYRQLSILTRGVLTLAFFLYSGVLHAADRLISLNYTNRPLAEILVGIESLLGLEIDLLGTLSDDSLFSVSVKHITLDTALRKLLYDYDYFLINSDQQVVIYVVGPASTARKDGPGSHNSKVISGVNSESPVQYISNVTEDGMSELIPVNNLDTGASTIQYSLNQTDDGIHELIPFNNMTAQSSDIIEYEVNVTSDGMSELIPVKNLTMNQTSNIEYIQNWAQEGFEELIPINNNSGLQTGDKYKRNVTDDGMVELIPIAVTSGKENL